MMNPVKKLAEQLANYSAYHRNPRNKMLHFIGVPMVTMSLFIFLGWFRFIHSSFPVTVAMIFFLGVSIYYILLDRQVGLMTVGAFLPILIVSHFISQAETVISVTWFFIFFVGGWMVQLLGHYFEGRRPALTDNILQIFNAPLFLCCEVLFLLHQRDDLKAPL